MRRPRFCSLLVPWLAASVPSATAAQLEPIRLAVGFTHAELVERPIQRLVAPAQEATPAGTFGNVLFSAAMLGAVGAIAGGFVGAGLNETGDDLYAVIQGAIVGAWIGGGVGGAHASGRPAPAFLGSALGVAAGLSLLDTGKEGLLLAPLMHGAVTALFTRLVPQRAP